MLIATWNVNSIRSRLDQVQDWLIEVQPDLLCLQETKVDDPLFPYQQLEIKLSNQIEILKLAKEITDELNIEQQLWLINWLQQNLWLQETNPKPLKQLEELRSQLL